jgi:DNA replication protein DnaC
MVTTPLDPDLAAALRRLRLGRLVPTLAERIALAEKQGTPFMDLLLMILTDEIARRDSSAAERRAEEAGLDPDMVLERFDAGAKITYDKRLLAELSSLRCLEQHKHVSILGSVGVGKTFLANALGHLACQHGYRVHFTRADAMLHRLKKSRFDNSRDDEMHALTTVDLLILDDFALEPMTRDESKDVYQLFVERTGRASMIITSNRDTSEWLAMFDDTLRAQSAIDRYMNAAYDLVIEGESYRPRQKPKLADDTAALPASPAPNAKASTPRRARRGR